MERLTSGIPGLDKMLQGGFPYPSIILLGGEPGTGKSTLGMQSLFAGAENGETCLFISAISEPAWVMQSFLSEFKFYNQKAIDTNKLIFSDLGESVDKEGVSVLDQIKKKVETYSPQRILIDPITAVKTAMKNDIKYRKFLHELMVFLKGEGCLTYITTEYSYDRIPSSIDAYMVDGILILSYLEMENSRKKYLEVLKLRGTNHLTGKRSVVISNRGIRVQPEFR